MKKTVCILLMIFTVILITGFAFAEAEEWEIDKNHSSLYFDVRHTYATVRGKFDDFSGTLHIDQDNLQKSSVAFEVNTASINTGIPNRDNHLRSEDFFSVKEYPTMSFRSSGVKHTGGNEYVLEGKLTIKGKTTKISIPFTYFGTRENPLKKGQMVAGFETHFSINRLDYGVGTGKFLEMGVIGNQVDILITLEALKNN
jgi:polyisoprenoid-binding protein YceI